MRRAYKDYVPITGVWLRAMGDNIQVLCEVDGVWSLVIDEFNHGPISHISEVGGIMQSPIDPVTEPRA